VRVAGALVTAEYFDVFGVAAERGRTFSGQTDAVPGEPLVVLSHAAWAQQFGADDRVVSSRVRLNGAPHTVVGVMPATFDYPEGAKVWVLSPKPVPLPPIDVPGELLESREVHYFLALGRLKPGISLSQASADLAAIADSAAGRLPDSNAGRGVRLEPLHERIVGDVREALFVLLGAVGVVLLVACANVASLLIARASGRQREIALRTALGATRARIVRQLVTESLVLGTAGGVVGLLAGSWAVALLLKVLPEEMPRAQMIGLDARVALAATGMSLVSALVFGLAPALQASRQDRSSALREANRGATGGRRRARTRAALVVVEIALTLVLPCRRGSS
jgi:putative ABC transport system permease protein